LPCGHIFYEIYQPHASCNVVAHKHEQTKQQQVRTRKTTTTNTCCFWFSPVQTKMRVLTYFLTCS